MKVLIVIIFLIFPGIVVSANAKDLKDKAIICKEINNEFKSMYGFKFVDLDHVRVLIKNSDTVDVLTDNILQYNATKEIIYIIGMDDNSMINYGFNIFRENLNVWAFNVTALEPFLMEINVRFLIKLLLNLNLSSNLFLWKTLNLQQK